MTGSLITGPDGDRDEDGREGRHGDGHDHDGEGETNTPETGDGDAAGSPAALDETGDPDDAAGIEWRDGPDLPPARASGDFGTADEPEQLELGDDDVRLPWLEAGDDEDVDDRAGSGQLLGMVVLGLLALVLIIGAIWWVTRRQADDTLVADGSVITAPDQPYKERPKDPGGKTFAGTGDTSFAVSEGQTRATRLDSGDAQPGFTAVPKPSEKAAAASAGSAGAASPAAASGVGVQVGAFSTKATAEAGWSKLQQQYSALSGLSHRVVEGKADIGTVYRLQAVAADAGAARTLCGQLRSSGLACQVKN